MRFGIFADVPIEAAWNFTEGSRQSLRNFAETCQLVLPCGTRRTPVSSELRPMMYIGGMFSDGNGTFLGRYDDMATATEFNFPCPVCMDPRDVKLTKKNKPYITCDPCGIQVFVRGPAGIAEFNRLIEQGERDGLATRLREMELRYRLTCPECGNKFWIERRLIKTSAFDGSLKGFMCPLNSCGALVPWEEKK